MQETYKIEKRDWAAKLMAIVVVVTMVTSTFVLFAPEASAKTGSDNYGYTYKDSIETDGPTYSWVDILSTGDKILCGSGQSCTTDGAQGPFDIGFSYDHYGNSFTSFYNGGDNGFISFGGSASSYSSATLPSTRIGNNAIAGGWFDGGFCKTQNPNSGVYYQTIGDEGSKKLVVTMQDLVNYYVRDGTFACRFGYASATDTITYQIILEQATGNIWLQYKDAVGGHGSDNEVLAAGIQGTSDGTLYGIEYMSRYDSSNIPDNTAVLFTPPPPKQNDLKLDSTSIPNPISLAEENEFTATVYNNGVNCETPGSCTPQPETDIDVTSKVFSVKETVTEYTFDDRADAEGFTTQALNGGTNAWTQAIDDGAGDYNYGSEGTSDGSWSAGRKSSTLAAAFTDQQNVYYDGTSVLVADFGTDSIKSIDTTTHAVTTVIGPDSTNLNYVLDISSDADYYYTLSKTYTWSSAVRVCKWDKDSLSSPAACNTTSVRYGTALAVFGTEIFVLQTSSSATYRKVVVLDTSDLSLTTKSISYGSGMSWRSYSQDIDVNDVTGDVYLPYRDSPGTIRAYHRQTDGSYGTTSAYYTQVSTGARLPIGIEEHNGFVYVHGYYGASYYGGMKKMVASDLTGLTTLWGATNFGYQYAASIAVTDDADIYLSSNYKYSYSSFRNNKDAVWFWDAADYGQVPTKTLGPAPGSLAALVSPVIDAEDAVGMSVSFDMSQNFYYNYGGAYMEASRDNGVTWEYIGKAKTSGKRYYGVVNTNYGNEIDPSYECWTRHDTNHVYSRNSNTEDWKTTTVTLDEFTGNAQVKFRIVVGYDTYGRSYLDSFFRVDDIKIKMLEADEIFVEETETIASLDFKASETVTFFDKGGDNTFQPSLKQLKVGDTVGISINVPGNANDVDKTNQRVVVFREVKYVIFSDNFDDGDKGWTTGTLKFGASTWAIRDRDSTSGSNSMDSGFRNSASVPGDPYIATPNLDLSLPVEASIQMKIAYYGYYTYDGYQAQISEDGGTTWQMIEPEGGYVDRNGVARTLINSAYWSNPLRGQKAFTYYGSSTGYTGSPDPQAYIDVVFNLNDYTGQDDIQFRWVAGWSRLYQWSGAYNSFLRMDDFAVTGLVYNDNVGLSKLDLKDPIGIDETVTLSTTAINAGINDQTSGAAKVRLQIGPLGLQTYDSSDDFETYTSLADAVTAGWSTDEECNTAAGSTCSSWGDPAGSTIVADGDVTAFGPGTTGFMMYSGAGTTSVTSPKLDFTGAENDLKLTLKHRYNFDYYGGMSSAYNGGNVQISTDDGTTWSLFTPDEGYSGSIGGYSSWGNPMFGEQAFVHCGDCSGVSNTASDNEDKYIESVFDMSKYVGEDEVRIKFVTGMWKYQRSTHGEHWYIDSLVFSATGMQSVVYENTQAISGSGLGGTFVQGDKFTMSKDYRFQVPGEYKIVFDAWIGAEGTGDDFAGDNIAQAIRETMFAVSATTADGTATASKNDASGKRYYTDDWVSSKDGGPAGGYQWAPYETGDSHSPVWSIGTDAPGTRPNGDDVSLTSPVVDLSQATSAKLAFDHRFAFYQSSGTYVTYYDGGRVEISTDEGETWAALPATGGELYGGPTGQAKLSTSTYYGNPLRGQSTFLGTSSAGTGFVSSECDLTSYMGEGFDSVMIRFRMGGGFSDWGSTWDVDNIGIYGLGFDLAQGASSLPYTLAVGEGSTITTSFSNQGQGNLGSGGVVEAAYAHAFVNDLSGNELWSHTTSLGDLDMASYAEAYVEEGSEKWLPTSSGESTPTMNFDFEGKDNGGNVLPAGVYTVGVMASDSEGNMLSDLFPGNNIDSHMLLIGRSADIGSPMLAGGPGWGASSNTPAEVGEALAVAWDQSDVATGTLNLDITAAGYSVVDAKVSQGTTVTWTNRDTASHTVTALNGDFDSMSIAPGDSWSLKMTELGSWDYASTNPADSLTGSLTVLATASVDKQARTNFVNVWSADSYLYFWAKHDLSEDSSVSVYAQKKGTDFDSTSTIALWEANGFKIMDGSDHTEVGNALSGMDDWKPYYIHLDSNRLGYNTLQYVPDQDNSYSFVFRARGVQGSLEIGNVQLIRTLDTGFFFAKSDERKLTYEIFPSLSVEINYFAKNIGTENNQFQFTPTLAAQGNDYAGPSFTISVEVLMNGAEYDDVTRTEVGNSTTYTLDMAPDDEALITIRYLAPDYDAEMAEPAGNRKFAVKLAPYDVGSADKMREPLSANLFIKPSQFVLGEIEYDRKGVLEGDSLAITVEAWNEGNYASDVLVVVYVVDPSGEAYDTPAGVQRLTRVASAVQPVMAPKEVLMTQPGDYNGHARTWYPVTAVWEEVFIPVTTDADYEIVELYAMINPDPEQQDLDNGFQKQDEYLNQKDDNDAFGSISIVKDKSSTPSFALGIIGMSVAALIAAAGASLRREEE